MEEKEKEKETETETGETGETGDDSVSSQHQHQPAAITREFTRPTTFTEFCSLYPKRPRQQLVVFNVLQDLQLVKRWKDLRVETCEPLDVYYLSGLPNGGQATRPVWIVQSVIVLPWLASDPLSVNIMTSLLHSIPSGSTEHERTVVPFALFGFMDSDSTIVYYRFHGGLVPPPSVVPYTE